MQANQIQPPQLSDESARVVERLDPPSQPPSTKDIAKAIQYVDDLVKQRAQGNVTEEEVVAGEIYKQKLLASQEDVEPAWFEGAMTRVMTPILTPIRNDIRGLKSELSRAGRISAKTYNLSCAGTGAHAQYEVVLFADGSVPTEPPASHNLPALTSPQIVKGLSTAQRLAYFNGYYPNQQARLNTAIRNQEILNAIGGRADG